METFLYYLFCAMCLGGGIGILLFPNYVNSAMSMLVSMLGVAGMLLLMKAYFLAFIMVTVYAGAVLVLFVFVMMMMGDRPDGISVVKKITLLVLWVCVGALITYFEPQILSSAINETAMDASAYSEIPFLAASKNYGYELFTTFMLPFQVAGLLLLVAMVGVIVVAKPRMAKK